MTPFRWLQVCCLLVISPTPLAAEEIELMYVERQGHPDVHDSRSFYAQVVTIVEDAFAETGDSFIWRELPIGRIVRAIEQNARATCSMAYRDQDREKVGKLTATIYRLQPMVAFARRDAGLKGYYEHITDLIFDHSKLGGTIRLSEDMPSRGASLINQYGDGASVLSFAASSDDLLRLIQLGRIHYMLISGNEADFYLSHPEWGSETFQKIRFGNLREAEELVLICSKATPDAWITRFNAAIARIRAANP